MKKLTVVVALLAATMFATVNANAQEAAVQTSAVEQSGEIANSEPVALLAGDGQLSYRCYTDEYGWVYLSYNNPTSSYYIINYAYTSTDGYSVKNYVEAKPHVKTSVQLGKGSSCRITSVREI